MLGDACLARRWHVGYAHIKCGWFVPADLNWEECEAMHRALRGEGLSQSQWRALELGGWGKKSVSKIEWSDRGKLVANQLQEILENAHKEAS